MRRAGENNGEAKAGVCGNCAKPVGSAAEKRKRTRQTSGNVGDDPCFREKAKTNATTGPRRRRTVRNDCAKSETERDGPPKHYRTRGIWQGKTARNSEQGHRRGRRVRAVR